MDVKKRMEYLSKILLHHQHLYYVMTSPEISDLEYDRLFDELLSLEQQHPEMVHPNSPTRRIGSDLDNTFPEKAHILPILSLNKVYSTEDIEKWMNKINKDQTSSCSFVVEEKIDGASIVLYYKKGELESALTRGNGFVGNDVTENIRTIPQVPMILRDPIDLAVRGEVYIAKSDFAVYNRQFNNKYANPRNLAAGSMRNIKSSQVAQVPLRLILYEGYFLEEPPNGHIGILSKLNDYGFQISQNISFFSNDIGFSSYFSQHFSKNLCAPLNALSDYVSRKIKTRKDLDYEIDGLVIKINELEVREELGHTSHHPRWAMAFKFEAPSAMTTLLTIQIQVGRNGRVTPVAILKPVQIAGSMVSRATLHNQEYIIGLELGYGDIVSISKRGDIIPAVEEVIDKSPSNPSLFSFPQECPFCQTPLEKVGSHHFCQNRECPERNKRTLIHFAGKNQMDIDSLGEKTLSLLFDKGYVKNIADLYTFDYNLLLNEEGFKEKKINNIKVSIKKSLNQPFRKVLSALGIDGLGSVAVSDLVGNGYDSIEKIIRASQKNDPEIFSQIEGFGEKTSLQIISYFTDKENLGTIQRLKEAGLTLSEESIPDDSTSKIFKDQNWVITGSFESFIPRSEAADEIVKRGGKVVNSVSSKTTFVLSGSSPGSKLQKARDLGIPIIDETTFIRMLSP